MALANKKIQFKEIAKPTKESIQNHEGGSFERVVARTTELRVTPTPTPNKI
jgi:hypothetical protein